MKKLAFILLVVLISGCDLGNLFGNKEDPVDIITYGQIHSGSQGIEASYLPDRPQSIYVVDTQQDIVLAFEIENKGAVDVTGGIISLNFDPLYVNFDEKHKNFDLLGRSIYSNKGEKKALFFNGKINALAEDKKEITINAVTCYDYSTEYLFDVCIDTDPANTRPNKKACDYLENKKKYSSLGGQGGPVIISKLDQTINTIPGGIETEFIIYITNGGKGKNYHPTS